MQAQGGPSRAELWDKGQQSTPDSFTSLTENSCSNQQSASKAKRKATPMRFIVGSIFPSEINILVEFVFFSLFSY